MNMRIGGLASGMDIDKLVNDLMKAERIPLTKMQQEKALLEWRRSDYREMNKLLFDLNNATFDMGLQSTYLQKSVSSTDDSKVTATASSVAGNTSFTLENATLATSAYNSSSADISADAANPIDPSQSLFSMKDSFAGGMTWRQQAVTGETQQVSADGTEFQLAHGAIDSGSAITIKVDGTEYTAYTDETAYNNDGSTKKVLVDSETGQLTFGETVSEGSNIEASYSYNNVDFSFTTYNEDGEAVDTDFTFEGTESLNSIIKQVNDSEAGVNMFYDQATDVISITRTASGNMNSGGKEMQFSGSFLTETLQLDSVSEKGGVDAEFTINGLTTTRHSNDFTINGVTFNLKSAIPAGESVKINVSSDTESVFENIKTYVEKYNEVIGKINDEITEERYRDFPPLTDKQREDMSESEIKLWEEKAKSGMLSRDSILSSGMNQMRLDFYSAVDGVSNKNFDQLSEIGITTSSDYLQRGKLEINEAELKEALADDPKAVMELFTKSGETPASMGIAQRLEKTIEGTMNRIEQKAGNTGFTEEQYTMGRKLGDLEDEIDDFQDRLTMVEDRYWRQFSAMEQAIQRANQQSAFIMNQFGGK